MGRGHSRRLASWLILPAEIVLIVLLWVVVFLSPFPLVQNSEHVALGQRILRTLPSDCEANSLSLTTVDFAPPPLLSLTG